VITVEVRDRRRHRRGAARCVMVRGYSSATSKFELVGERL